MSVSGVTNPRRHCIVAQIGKINIFIQSERLGLRMVSEDEKNIKNNT